MITRKRKRSRLSAKLRNNSSQMMMRRKMIVQMRNLKDCMERTTTEM
jgi:hypothetical protein